MNETGIGERLLVSVIMPTYNEARMIEGALRSLLNQEAPNFDLEILVVDGNSSDGTRRIVAQIAEADPRVRLLFNEKRRTPFAFNIGLREARGTYVCILGAHTVYNQDYISVCLNELLAHGAAGCTGRVITRPANDTLQAQLAAWVLSHPFGSSSKSFRTQSEGFADIINFPVMLKKPMLEVGGYDEELARNQDNDMNQKLRARGHKLYCTWKTHCIYHPKDRLLDLFQYAYRNGFWNVLSFKKNLFSLGIHHLVPFFFLIGFVFSLGLAISGLFTPQPYRSLLAVPYIVVLGLHLGAGWLSALQVSIREKSPRALLLPLVFLAFHLAYGFGTFSAFVTNAKLPASTPERLAAAKG